MVEQLKIYDLKLPKIRYGREWDGGYVLPKLMSDECVALFTYGVGDDSAGNGDCIAFEVDFIANTRKKAYLFDHTTSILKIPIEYLKYFEFVKEGLSYEKKPNLDTFFKHYEEANITGQVLLKMDIEGDEFDFFLNTDIEKLAKLITGIIIEFHPTDNPIKINKYFLILEKLNQYFYPCHIHGNNYANTTEVNDNGFVFNLPCVNEMTFINKELVLKHNGGIEPELDMNDYPTIYDRKNDTNKPEIPLDFLKKINNLDKTENLKIYNNESIYISLTTVPLRLNNFEVLKKNLDSLLNQKTDKAYKVILSIPFFYANNNDEEYIISQELSDYAKNNSKLIINRVVKDYGPIVKITGAINYVDNPEAIIIVCDDDQIYHEDMLEYHIKKLNEYPDSITCFRGDDCVDKRYWFEDNVMHYVLKPTAHFFPVKKDSQIIRPGHWHSAGYRRKYFDNDFLDESFLKLSPNDDVLSGYYFRKKQIDVICVAYDKETDFRAVNENGRGASTFPIVYSLPFHNSGFYEFRVQSNDHMGFMDDIVKKEFHDNNHTVYSKIIKPVEEKKEIVNEPKSESTPTQSDNMDSLQIPPKEKLDIDGRRIVISMTTIPSRLKDVGEEGMKRNINSLINQDFDGEYEIHLNVPKIHKHTGEEYVIPDWLREVSLNHPKFKIFEGLEDYGSISKIVETLKRVTEPNAILIVCDDDLVYHPRMVYEQVKNQLNYKDTVCGYDGGLAKKNEFGDVRNHFVASVPRDIEVRVLQHYKTVSYQRYFFGDDFFTDFLNISWNDDIAVSAYMGKNKFNKIVRTCEWEEKLITLEQWQAKGGVTTFPVLSHTAHDGAEGCWHHRSKGDKDNHERLISLGWL